MWKKALIICLGVVALAPVRNERSFAVPAKKGKRHKKRLRIASMDRVMRKVDKKLLASSSHPSYGNKFPIKHVHGKKDKTLAPYFHIPGKGQKGMEGLPLKATGAKVQIAGVIAQVTVNQVYKNTGNKPIEAVYVFPGSTRAAVHGMRMKIGKRIIEANIKERKAARAAYEKAKRQGRRASLLEKQRPSVFTMNVANIMPGDTIKVELEYSELLVPEDGLYEFVYPTVVGPRYGGGANPTTDKWIANPYLKSGQKPTYKFGLNLHIKSPIGIKQLTSPSHKLQVKYISRSEAQVGIKGVKGGNRDFVLRYRLAGNKIESGVITYKKGKEKFFLVMMEPPKRVKKKQMPPREYIFVLDVSGSMYGFPLNTAKTVITKLLSGLRRNDYFNVVLFAGTSHVMRPRSLRATAGNVQKALNIINRQRGGGGTELLGALKNAYSIKRIKKHVSRSVVVVTDGYVGVEKKTFRFIRKNLGNTNCFAFGIGSSVNRGLIEGMARAGMGEPFVVLSPKEASKTGEKFRKYIEAPVLTEIKLRVKGAKAYDMVPKSPPDLLAKRPLIVFGKLRGRGRGKIKITGYTGGGRFTKTLSFQTGTPSTSSPSKPLRVLWARKWVERLSDELAMLPGNTDIKQAITNLGLGYNLLTPYTSFVAIDSKIVRKNGKLVTVKQPLPLPKGVSNYAVGGRKGRRYSARRVYSRTMTPRGGSAPMGSGGLSGYLVKAKPKCLEKTTDSSSPSPKKRARVQISGGNNLKSAWRRRLIKLIKYRIQSSSCIRRVLAKHRGHWIPINLVVKPNGNLIIRTANSALRRCLSKRLSKTMGKFMMKGAKNKHKKVVLKLRLRL